MHEDGGTREWPEEACPEEAWREEAWEAEDMDGDGDRHLNAVGKQLTLAGLSGLTGLCSLRHLQWVVMVGIDSRNVDEAAMIAPLTVLRALQVLDVRQYNPAAGRARTAEVLKAPGWLCDLEVVQTWEVEETILWD